jgi:hypothetical protein
MTSAENQTQSGKEITELEEAAPEAPKAPSAGLDSEPNGQSQFDDEAARHSARVGTSSKTGARPYQVVSIVTAFALAWMGMAWLLFEANPTSGVLWAVISTSMATSATGYLSGIDRSERGLRFAALAAFAISSGLAVLSALLIANS